jgi:hypothetical protein
LQSNETAGPQEEKLFPLDLAMYLVPDRLEFAVVNRLDKYENIGLRGLGTWELLAASWLQTYSDSRYQRRCMLLKVDY